MTKKGKIFEMLCAAFPLKPIRDDRHLEAALGAIDKVNAYLDKHPNHRNEGLLYLLELEELITDYKEDESVH
jgi:hypothetical protein